MGYYATHEEVPPHDGKGEPHDDIMGFMVDEPERQVDYLTVVMFLFILLDSKLTVSELSDALDTASGHIPGKHTTVMTNTPGRARLAVDLVENFLMKDSFERGLKKPTPP